MPARSRLTQRTALGASALAVALVALAACGETLTQVTESDVIELRMSLDSAEIGVGSTLQLRAYPIDASGALLVGTTVTWRSLTTSVATVDAAGLVTGVAVGTTPVIAQVASFSDTTHITVKVPPTLVLSDDSIGFQAVAGGSDPAPQSVDITNSGELALVGLAVDSIVYGSATTGWLAAALDSPSAPATLDLTASTAGITTAGTYTAIVWLSATDAVGSPAQVEVTLRITAAAAASLTINDGDGQAAQAGAAVTVAPSVLLRDAFDNPLVGASVAFAVTGGGGSLTGAPATTNASGIARVGSWTLGNLAGPNQVTATFGVLAPVVFNATGVPGPAAKVVVVDGNDQSAVAGNAVATPPSVAVQDALDNGVSGVAVTFSVASGGGSITGASQVSDANGVAQVGSWTLGTTAGPNTLSVSAAGVATPAIVTATGLSGTAAKIQLVAGTPQSDTVAATLPTAYQVIVLDTNDNPVAGYPVNWSVTAGGGTIAGSTTTSVNTNASGVSSAVRVLGTAPGTHTAQAAVPGLQGSPIAFTATASVGSPDEIRLVAGTNNQTATVNTTVPIAPAVIVEDKFNNPIQSHSVTFSVQLGGGTVNPTTAIMTNAQGRATVTSWTLGTAAGTSNNTLRAQASGTLPVGNPVTFTASATAGAPASISIVQGNSPTQTAVTGNTIGIAPTVEVRDQFTNVVPGAVVNFAASGGGSPASANVTTAANGRAATSWTVVVGTHAMSNTGTFVNTLTASVTGAPSVQFSAAAIYSYSTHVNPIWSPNGCAGCHSSLFGSTTPSTNRNALVNQNATCYGTSSTIKRVSGAGGVSAADNNSVLMWFVDPSLNKIPTGGCDSTTNMSLSAANIKIIRAWIRNGAPDN